ncbi:MAG: fibronectin type III domain-containing protein [Candidatus Coatesbacteria bacterium]|nr:MAG: fibronectin type III domain-containing protein [Candidatus Coatesbacteria bacterium]
MTGRFLKIILVSVFFVTPLAAVGAGAQSDVLAQNLTASDTEFDSGGSININWEPAPGETNETLDVDKYVLLRGESPEGPFEEIFEAVSGNEAYTYVDENVSNGVEYYYKVRTVAGGITGESAAAGPVVASWQLFNLRRVNILIASIILSALVLYYITQARAGKKLFIRRIGGLEAVQEAVGRATEMGKSVLYVPGIGEIDDIQTIASVTILGRIATMVAEYDADLLVPCSRSLVMSTAQEVVKESYLEAGRPDAYKQGNIRYLTDDQFGYVAGVDGIMIRERPAACFYLGTFYAESLILAETGHSVGAIQIAGTAMPSQLPFFIAACDYTLIGEELFAASAYLSREPRLLGSLVGQDWGKVIILLFILLGAVLAVVDQLGLTVAGYSLDISRWFIVR